MRVRLRHRRAYRTGLFSDRKMLLSSIRDRGRRRGDRYTRMGCSPGLSLRLFARDEPPKWAAWGNQADEAYAPM